MKKNPRVSIIIPTLNEEKYLPHLIASLKRQTFRDFELIVSDAGSKDKTIDIAHRAGARVVKGGIPSVGRNTGANVAKGEILFFIDADIIFAADFLSRSILEFEKENSDIATCINEINSLGLSQRLGYKIVNLFMYSSKYLPFKYGNTQTLLCKKEVFNFLKGFNNQIEAAEDIDLIRRAHKTGYKYSILDVPKLPSDRRYKKNNISKVAIGYILSLVFVYFPSTRNNTKLRKIIIDDLMGGWGKF